MQHLTSSMLNYERHCLTTRRKRLISRFYNNANGKTGEQSLQNRLQHMDCLNKECLEKTWTNDKIRITLKTPDMDSAEFLLIEKLLIITRNI